MSSEKAIEVRGLSKSYEIYQNPQDRLKQIIFPRIQHHLGLKQKKYYRSFQALKQISFDVNRGETLGIVGLNGSGKSTLLKLICGTLTPSTGTVHTHGRVAALLELGTGFNPEFTGKENIFLNAAILGLSEVEIKNRYDSILEFADIGDFINQPVKQYSSGMYVRLAFAVIANVSADILIIDEALAVGDMVFSQKCMRFLREFKENGTVLFVSHNSAAIVNLCDRAIWLEKGENLAIGPAKDICEKYLARRYNSKITDNRKINRGPDVVESSSRNDLLSHAQAHDMRMLFINNSNLRNDIKIFDFNKDTKSFGTNGATITNAALEDAQGRKLSWMVGGELARISVEATVHTDCNNLIVGFNIKDKLGQVVLAQNTCIATQLDPVSAKAESSIEAIFNFRLPVLPKGLYSVDVAIAEGTPPDVVQLQWVHDAFIFESQISSVMSGLVGLSCGAIELRSKSCTHRPHTI